jgi:hypothetical protein
MKEKGDRWISVPTMLFQCLLRGFQNKKMSKYKLFNNSSLKLLEKGKEIKENSYGFLLSCKIKVKCKSQLWDLFY